MKTIVKLVLAFTLGASIAPAGAALVSRLFTFQDGQILTASQLNSEFNNLVDGVNSITDENIASSANINPLKIGSTIAGDGLGRGSTTGVLSINVDNVGVEVSGDILQLKNSGVVTAKIADDSVTKAKLGSDLTDNSTLEQDGTQTLQVKDLGITTAKLAAGAVTQAKRAALTYQLSSSSGGFSTGGGPTQVTNHSVTITSTGRPVFVGMIGDVVNSQVIFQSTNGSNRIIFKRDGADISVNAVSTNPSGTLLYYPCSSFGFVDVPSSGSRTYTTHAFVSGSGTLNTFVINCKLIAYEL